MTSKKNREMWKDRKLGGNSDNVIGLKKATAWEKAEG